MNRREREADPGESFDGGYHLYAQEMHRQQAERKAERKEGK